MRNGILTLTFIFVASLAFAQAPASPVAGAWEGAIAVGAVKLRLGVTISAQPDGQLTATMDSPDQGAYGMRLSDVSFADGVLKFALRQANGAFEGRLNAAGTEIWWDVATNGTAPAAARQQMDGVIGDHLFPLSIQKSPQRLLCGLLGQEAGDLGETLSAVEHGCPEIMLRLRQPAVGLLSIGVHG